MNRLDLNEWKLEFQPNWDVNFKKFDESVKQKILKKINQMKQPLQSRGLHSSRYQIEEIGQYRIAFIQNSETRTKRIYFVGNHKQYEKWYLEFP